MGREGGGRGGEGECGFLATLSRLTDVYIRLDFLGLAYLFPLRVEVLRHARRLVHTDCIQG